MWQPHIRGLPAEPTPVTMAGNGEGRPSRTRSSTSPDHAERDGHHDWGTLMFRDRHRLGRASGREQGSHRRCRGDWDRLQVYPCCPPHSVSLEVEASQVDGPYESTKPQPGAQSGLVLVPWQAQSGS